MTPGAVFTTAQHEITAEEITSFALAYDPQRLHLDEQWARAGPFGDVIASGFQTLALAWRLWAERGMGVEGRGGVGMTDVRWHRPVLAGAVVHCRVRIAEARTTRGGRGLVVKDMALCDETGTSLVTFTVTALIARRGQDVPGEPPPADPACSP